MIRELITEDTKNPAVENGDLNQLVWKHQGMILSHFVEDGGKGLRQGLFDLTRDVSDMTFKKALEYEYKGLEKFITHAKELFSMFGINKPEDMNETHFFRSIIESCGGSITGDEPMTFIVSKAITDYAGSVDAKTWITQTTIEQHRLAVYAEKSIRGLV